ncbi:hypothetical protein AAG570_005632 [Ranatra chinensis]|uniref:Chromo domain-containing protein n=1 Tax=Ranatra chinensis TaxID=642074 RepID=A0ABD0XY03_9HEMI
MGRRSGSRKSVRGNIKQAGSPLQDLDHIDDDNYEVEAIIDDRKEGNKTHYLVLWKGCKREEATWECESDLNCNQLLNKYLTEKEKQFRNGEGTSNDLDAQVASVPKKKGVAKKKKREPPTGEENEPLSRPSKFKRPGANADGEYQVERIVDVHIQKGGKREFLVKWVGYSSDENTWEPEKNLQGTAVLDRFLEKLEKINRVRYYDAE